MEVWSSKAGWEGGHPEDAGTLGGASNGRGTVEGKRTFHPNITSPLASSPIISLQGKVFQKELSKTQTKQQCPCSLLHAIFLRQNSFCKDDGDTYLSVLSALPGYQESTFNLS